VKKGCPIHSIGDNAVFVADKTGAGRPQGIGQSFAKLFGMALLCMFVTVLSFRGLQTYEEC